VIKKSFEGKWLRILFYDHSITSTSDKSKEPMRCEVSGYCHKVTKKHVELWTWCVRSGDLETRSHNAEKFVILQKCILDYGIQRVEWLVNN
jgi:hypothetical protein